MKLYDVIEEVKIARTAADRTLESKVESVLVANKEIITKFSEAIELHKKKGGSVPYEVRTFLTSLYTSANEELEENITPELILRATQNSKIVGRIGQLGNSIVETELSSQTKLTKLPKTNIKEILKVSEKVGLICIPEEHVNFSQVKNDKTFISSNQTIWPKYLYGGFSEECNKWGFRMWMVCPLQYYSIENHSNNTNLEMFSPSSIRQSFTAVKLVLPMLIGMKKSISALEISSAHMQEQMRMLSTQIEQQQQQIQNLKSEIQMQQERAAQEKMELDLEFSKIMQAQTAVNTSSWWELDDPMLIAVPKSVTNINTYNGEVFMGPAWGPDISEVLVELHNLKSTNRKNMSEIIKLFH